MSGNHSHGEILSMKIKLMADYCSSGLWNWESGIMLDKQDVPLSPELMERVTAWVAKYDRENWDWCGCDDVEHPEFDYRAFTDAGIVIAHDMKREHPDWDIYVFDEAAHGLTAEYIEMHNTGGML